MFIILHHALLTGKNKKSVKFGSTPDGLNICKGNVLDRFHIHDSSLFVSHDTN